MGLRVLFPSINGQIIESMLNQLCFLPRVPKVFIVDRLGFVNPFDPFFCSPVQFGRLPFPCQTVCTSVNSIELINKPFEIFVGITRELHSLQPFGGGVAIPNDDKGYGNASSPNIGTGSIIGIENFNRWEDIGIAGNWIESPDYIGLGHELLHANFLLFGVHPNLETADANWHSEFIRLENRIREFLISRGRIPAGSLRNIRAQSKPISSVDTVELNVEMVKSLLRTGIGINTGKHSAFHKLELFEVPSPEFAPSRANSIFQTKKNLIQASDELMDRFNQEIDIDKDQVIKKLGMPDTVTRTESNFCKPEMNSEQMNGQTEFNYNMDINSFITFSLNSSGMVECMKNSFI